MAYVTGSAADMAAVKTALVNACTANGWTEQTDSAGKTVLSNSGCYVRVEVIADKDGAGNPALELLGRTGLDTGDAPYVVSMGPVNPTGDVEAILFPVAYHAFIFTNEVYFVIQYSDIYQWCAFGQSQQNGLPGTGNWVAATLASDNIYGIDLDTWSGGNSYHSPGALFWGTNDSLNAKNAWLHNSFETSYPWALGNSSNSAYTIGIRYLTELIEAQPNQFSGEAVLLPIRAYKQRLDSKISQVLELSYARHVRIDNYTAEQVVALGTDEWMVFPYYRKDATNRDGGGNPGYEHTGTFGWALKKA